MIKIIYLYKPEIPSEQDRPCCSRVLLLSQNKDRTTNQDGPRFRKMETWSAGQPVDAKEGEVYEGGGLQVIMCNDRQLV